MRIHLVGPASIRGASGDRARSDHGAVRLASLLFAAFVLAAVGATLLRAPAANARTNARLESRLPISPTVASTSAGAGSATFAAKRSGLGYRLSGGGVTGLLSTRRVVLRAQGSRLSLTALEIGRDGPLRSPGPASISAHTNRVVQDHGSVRVSYAAGPSGIEQVFELLTRPAGRGGQVTVALRTGGSLRPQRTRAGAAFVTTGGAAALRYGELTAIDARGASLPVSVTVSDGKLLVRVTDAHAHYPVRIDPLIQVGPKIVPVGATGPSQFGASTAMSADGTTALVGGYQDNNGIGAVWVYTRTDTGWSQQAILKGAGEISGADFGAVMALSADGTTAVIGGKGDNGRAGAAYVFTRSGSTWTQQAKLTPTGQVGSGLFGDGVAISPDGNEVFAGAPNDNGGVGGVWEFTRAGSVWTQQAIIRGTGQIGAAGFGATVALSSDNSTLLVDGDLDNNYAGAGWVFTNTGTATDPVWSQQAKLTATGEVDQGEIGRGSVALSANGDTALLGAYLEDDENGAAYVFTRAGGDWTQQTRLTGGAFYGISVALTADGNTALVGSPGQLPTPYGRVAVLTRVGSTWTLQSTLTGTDVIGHGQFGSAVAISADGGAAMIGGNFDNDTGTNSGAAWAFGVPEVQTATQLGFGSQVPGGVGGVNRLSVANSGQGPLTFTSAATISGDDASDFSIPTGDDLCNGQTIAPGASCQIGVLFIPSEAGVRTATLTLGDNDSSPLSATITLTGTGVAASAPTPPTTPTTPPGPTAPTLTCPAATGRLHDRKLGPFFLGETRDRARLALPHYTITHNRFDRFCLSPSRGIRVGYPSRGLLATLTPHQRRAVQNRIVLALTANPHYTLLGIHSRSPLTALSAHTRDTLTKPFQVGLNTWYLRRDAHSFKVLKVRDGTIQEIGVASKAVMTNRRAEARFLPSFP